MLGDLASWGPGILGTGPDSGDTLRLVQLPLPNGRESKKDRLFAGFWGSITPDCK